MRLNRQSVLMVCTLGALLLPSAMFADTPGRHPAYLHALTDLRYARAYLDRLGDDNAVDNDSRRAIGEIDAAINEIRRASIDDGKNLEDHPAVDAHLKRTDRFHKALELLDKAHNDVARVEADEGARGLRNRAIQHIDEAHRTVDRAIGAALR